VELCKKMFEVSDPIYMGPIQNKEFISQVMSKLTESDFKQKQSESEMLFQISGEIGKPLYFDVNYLAKKQHLKIPKMGKVMDILRENGYEVSRTHFSNTGLKTSASFQKLISLL